MKLYFSLVAVITILSMVFKAATLVTWRPSLLGLLFSMIEAALVSGLIVGIVKVLSTKPQGD